MADGRLVFLLSPAWTEEVPAEELPMVLAALAAAQATLAARLCSLPMKDKGAAPTPPETPRLLTAEQASSILGVSPRWLYRHASNLPFTRRLSRKALRFDEAGLRRWQATKKP